MAHNEDNRVCGMRKLHHELVFVITDKSFFVEMYLERARLSARIQRAICLGLGHG